MTRRGGNNKGAEDMRLRLSDKRSKKIMDSIMNFQECQITDDDIQKIMINVIKKLGNCENTDAFNDSDEIQLFHNMILLISQSNNGIIEDRVGKIWNAIDNTNIGSPTLEFIIKIINEKTPFLGDNLRKLIANEKQQSLFSEQTQARLTNATKIKDRRRENIDDVSSKIEQELNGFVSLDPNSTIDNATLYNAITYTLLSMIPGDVNIDQNLAISALQNVMTIMSNSKEGGEGYVPKIFKISTRQAVTIVAESSEKAEKDIIRCVEQILNKIGENNPILSHNMLAVINDEQQYYLSQSDRQDISKKYFFAF